MSLPPAYNSIKELGVYDTLPQDVKLSLPSLVDLPKEAQDKAHEAMAAELAKPETTANLMAEVKALADGAIKVDEAFERVRIGLGKVDNNEYKDKNGDPIPKYQPRWVDYQKRWTKLLWGSREVATATEAYIKDFVEVIIPIVEAIQTDADLADAKKDLGAFMKRTDPFGKKLNSSETEGLAQKYSQDFTDLSRDLAQFKGEFDEFAKDKEAELGAAITSKQADIDRLNIEIKQCQTVVAAMGIALGVTVFATAAGAVAALAGTGPAAPFVALAVVIAGAIAAVTELGVLIAYVVKTAEKKNELEEAKRQLEDLQGQLAQLQALKVILQSQKEDITDICGRLDQFAAIWGTVKHDAGLINDRLEAAVGDDDSKKSFKLRVNVIKESYTKLGDALALYATNINNSGAKPETQ